MGKFLTNCIKYAEGFERTTVTNAGDLAIRCPDGEIHHTHYSSGFISFDKWVTVYYPLLLRQAVEGIMRETRFELSFIYDRKSCLYFEQIRCFKSIPTVNTGASVGTSLLKAHENMLMSLFTTHRAVLDQRHYRDYLIAEYMDNIVDDEYISTTCLSCGHQFDKYSEDPKHYDRCTRESISEI